jgi:hypothetical protein
MTDADESELTKQSPARPNSAAGFGSCGGMPNVFPGAISYFLAVDVSAGRVSSVARGS